MLPVQQRLRDNRDFRRVYARGRSYVHHLAVLYVLRRTNESVTTRPGWRIGFVVSKKQGKATARNRIKRRLREAVRLRQPVLREGPFDLIFVARGRLRAAAWPEVREAVDTLLKNAGMLMLSEEDQSGAGSRPERTGEREAGAGGD